jgi:hypothetical protein
MATYEPKTAETLVKTTEKVSAERLSHPRPV